VRATVPAVQVRGECSERWTPSATALLRCRRRDPPYYVPEGDSPRRRRRRRRRRRYWLHLCAFPLPIWRFLRRRMSLRRWRTKKGRRRRRKVYSKLTQ